MKILFSADWHLKLGQKNVPVVWAKKRYDILFEQLHELEGQADLHIIGGDLFDRAPTLEELELYFDYLLEIECQVIIFPGNHEATKKHETFFEHLELVTDSVSSDGHSARVVVSPENITNDSAILPYNWLKRKDWGNIVEKANVLFTHVRGEIPPHVKPEVPLEKFDKFKVVFAGDLHAHSNTQRNIVYPGSPVTTSFHRSEVNTGVIMIDSEDWSWEWKELDVPQLIRKTVSSPDEMVPTPYHHTIYELEGDMENLSKVKSSDLLDKKVVKRQTEATLILEPEMNMEQELQEYLTFILELPDSTVSSILTRYQDVNTA